MQPLTEAVPCRIYTALTNKSTQFCHPLRYRNGSTATFMGHRSDRLGWVPSALAPPLAGDRLSE